MMIQFLSVLTIFSAYLTIHGEYQANRALVYVSKPLTMLFIIAIAFLIGNPVSEQYQRMILIGLLFSLMGDIWLMLPGDRFLFGLLSFFAAHVCYIVAFGFNEPLSLAPLRFLPFLTAAMVVFWLLRPNLGGLQRPVFYYTTIIALMAWFALERWLASEYRSSLLAFIGALFFMISDTLLAFDRFKKRFHKARFYVLSTYYTSQWLIAFSVTAI